MKTENLRKKGWSDVKILRAQEDHLRQVLIQKRGDGTSYKQDLYYWAKTIPEVVHVEGWLGLVLFWDDNKSKCQPSEKRIISIQDLSPEILCSMQPGVLYCFVK